MLTTDFIMLAASIGYCTVWLFRGISRRQVLLWALPSIALVSAITGVVSGRWQAGVGALVAAAFLLVQLVGHLRGKHRSAGLPWRSGLFFIVLTGVAFVPLYLIPIYKMPRPSGPYAIGLRDFELVDMSRLGVMDANADTPRRLFVRVWYPAGSTAGRSRRPYASPAEVRTTFLSLGRDGLPEFFFTHLGLVKTHAFESAPVLPGDAPLPVLFFSHGYGLYPAQNTVLMEHLASHGYVIFSIAHTYDAADVLFPNGDRVKRSTRGYEIEEEEASETQQPDVGNPGVEKLFASLVDSIAAIQNGRNIKRQYLSSKAWLNDRLFVLDALERGEAPTFLSNLLSRCDFSRIGHMGMSFGGSTAGAICYLDKRCAAAINFDGSDYYHWPINADIPAPFLMFQSDFRNGEQAAEEEIFFNDFAYERFETAGLRNDVTRLWVRDITHLGLSDFALMLRQPLRGILVGDLDGTTFSRILNDVVLAFLDKSMRGYENGFPDRLYRTYSDKLVPRDISPVREWWLGKSPEERAASIERLEHVRNAAASVIGLNPP